MPFVGHRAQRFSQQLHRGGLDRQLALASGHDHTVGPDPIAKVERIDGVKDIVADDGLADEQLHVVGSITNGEEEQLALVALQHDATAHCYCIGGFTACSKLAILGANFTEAVRAIKSIWVWVGASGTQMFDFG